SPLAGETGPSPSNSRNKDPSISSSQTRRLRADKELGQREIRATLERPFSSIADYTDCR
ncbi:hypothetical protein scyTo_0009220, partial [Scyliorhinus torazame]|nr:hypothetical protein [Scyliorhinus torazame]